MSHRKQDVLKVLYWNARGVLNKTLEIQEFLKSHPQDIIAISETYLKPGQKIFLKNFTIHRSDRLNKGGGVLIAVKHGFLHKIENPVKTSMIENITISLPTNKGTIYITSIYNPPNNKNFKEDLRKIANHNRNNFIIGDFNAKHKLWLNHRNNTQGILLNKYINTSEYSLLYPNNHTRLSNNGEHSTIDIGITNTQLNYTKPEVLCALNSDHLPVQFSIRLEQLEKSEAKKPKYHKANWELFKSIIQNELPNTIHMNNNEEINIEIDKFTNLIKKAVDISIPKGKTQIYTAEVDEITKKLIQTRNTLKRRLQRNRNNNIQPQINLLNNMIHQRINLIRKEHWEKIISKLQTGSKSYWKIIKALKNTTRNIPNFKINNNIIANGKEKTELLADIFEKNHKATENITHPEHNRINSTVPMIINTNSNAEDSLFTTISEIKDIINNSRPLKAGGSDSIINLLIKKLPEEGFIHLCNIYNKCITNAYFPTMWKNATVVAIPKTGKNPENAENYRPISLLCSMGKIFEKIILSRLQSTIDNIIQKEQFGFRKQHSTTLQTLRIVNKIQNNKRRKSTGMILLDIEKAFDTVWHEGLIYKLKNYNINSHIIKIIHSFITNRTFQVKINKDKSRKRNITAGVPQGSCLSPILYMIYISDIRASRNCDIALYADDMALIADSTKEQIVTKTLQEGIKAIEDYSLKWKIKINNNKSKGIFFPKNKKWKNQPSTKIKIGNTNIEWDKETTYLGITLDQNLTFGPHIDKIQKKTNKVIGSLYSLIGRKSTLSINGKNTIYKTIIRPVITYGAAIYKYMAKTHHIKLQRIQNKCLKIINKLPRRYSTLALHQQSGFPTIEEYNTKLITKIASRSQNSDYDLIREIEF